MGLSDILDRCWSGFGQQVRRMLGLQVTSVRLICERDKDVHAAQLLGLPQESGRDDGSGP